MTAARSTGRWLDPVLAGLVFAISAGCLGARPLYLGNLDEAHYLHEAKRLLGGDRLYRDIFELTTPGWVYLMALLFEIFGATLRTARMAAAVIQASTATLVFVVCRQLAVRRGLALACAATYLFVCASIWRVASQHWLACLLGVVVLLLCLLPPRAWSAFSLGLVVGLAIAVHQARGIAMALGVACFLIVDAPLRRRGDRPSLTTLGTAFVAGVLIVTVSVLGAAVASAGLEPVWYALVVHPMRNYAVVFQAPWGWSGTAPALSVAGVLKYMPLALLCAVPRVVGWGRPGRDPARVRAGTALIILGVSLIFSVWYFPDFIHLAFIAPLFLVALADGVERALHLLPERVQLGAGWVVSAAILAPVGVSLASELGVEARRMTTVHDTAFGPIAISPAAAAQIEKLAAFLNAVPARTLYCHPFSGYTYLLLDARNPTRFEFVRPGAYNTPAQVGEVIRVLRTQQVPYVQMNPAYADPRDPINAFIRERYELAPDAWLRGSGIWRRRPDPPDAPMPGE